MLEFDSYTPPPSEPVFNVQEVPKEMDIYYKSESAFLPEGKTIADLTPEETRVLQNQYRFSPLRPGIFQAITFITKNNQSP
jgi:hypothetical protein